jgi:hypothetical protein
MCAAPPNASGKIRGNNGGKKRIRAALGEPDTKREVLRDAVERHRRHEGKTDRLRAGIASDQKIDCDERRGADDKRSGRAGKAGLSMRWLEQLERDGHDQRTRREREHSGRQLLRRRPEAAERRADHERSAGDGGVE